MAPSGGLHGSHVPGRSGRPRPVPAGAPRVACPALGTASERAHLHTALFRRVADPDQPVLWLDQMPARSLSRGFTNHINLIR